MTKSRRNQLQVSRGPLPVEWHGGTFNSLSNDVMQQDSKNLEKFLGKWNRETETRKLNKANNLNNLQPAGESQDLIFPN